MPRLSSADCASSMVGQLAGEPFRADADDGDADRGGAKLDREHTDPTRG